jgi:hypothetical protein
LDAHPEAAQESGLSGFKPASRFGNVGSQLKSMFDSIKSRSIFSNYSLSETE